MRKIYFTFILSLVMVLPLAMRASTAVVYIDKADAVDFFVRTAGDWEQSTLANSGDTPNNVAFSTEKCDLQFMPIDMLRGINQITKNGEVVDAFDGSAYVVSGVADGDVIRVVVESPVYDCTVTLAGTPEAISRVDVEGKTVTVTGGVFAAKTFDQVLLFSAEDYTIQSVDVNGKAASYVPASGCYVFNVLDQETVVTVTAEEKKEQTRPVAFTLTDASAVGIYVSASAYRQGDEATMDEGVVMVSSEKPYVQVEVADGYKVVSAQYVTTGGETADMSYASFEGYYFVDVFAKDVKSIIVETEKDVAEMITVTVYVDDVDALSGYFIRTSDRDFPFDSDEGPYLVTGTQTLTIKAEQNPIRLNLDFKGKPTNNVYLNDDQVTTLDMDETSVWGDFSLIDGALLRIYTDPGAVVGITSVSSESSDSKVYNILGAEVPNKNLHKGIYIIKGKKVVVK